MRHLSQGLFLGSLKLIDGGVMFPVGNLEGGTQTVHLSTSRSAVTQQGQCQGLCGWGRLRRTWSRDSALGFSPPTGCFPAWWPGVVTAPLDTPLDTPLAPSSVWTEPEPALCRLLPGSSVSVFSADARGLIYAFYSSSRRCYRSLRTEIKICILQVQIYCTYSFTISLQGAPLIL